VPVALCCIYVTVHVVVSFFELCVDVFVISEVHKVKTSQLRSSLDDLSVTAVIGHRHIKSSNFRFRGFYFLGELSIKMLENRSLLTLAGKTCKYSSISGLSCNRCTNCTYDCNNSLLLWHISVTSPTCSVVSIMYIHSFIDQWVLTVVSVVDAV